MNHLINAILNEPWAITGEALTAILKIIDRDPTTVDPAIFHASGQTEPEALMTIGGERLEGARRAVLRDTVAVLPVMGPIFPRSNLLTEYSGATSVEMLGKDFQAALDNPRVESIILNVDSPGGLISGISEFAEMVFAAQSKKRVLAYVFGSAASGAYWIASATSEITATDTGRVGSIGVVTAFRDEREKDAKAGVKDIEIVSSQSPYKRVDPATDAGRARIQKIVDDLAAVFVGAVAKHRGTDSKTVLKDFGQGDILVTSEALAAGMIDSIGSLESLIETENDHNNQQSQTQGGFVMSDKTKDGAQTISAEGVRETSPDTFTQIENQGKEAGQKAGAEGERQRILDIQSIKAPGYENLISEGIADPNATKATVSQKILEAQEAKREAEAAAQQKDGADTATASAGVEQPDPGSEASQQKEMADAIASGGNDYRERKGGQSGQLQMS
jgi:signal peptide peptidase SppA